MVTTYISNGLDWILLLHFNDETYSDMLSKSSALQFWLSYQIINNQMIKTIKKILKLITGLEIRIYPGTFTFIGL